ncbi:MAG TPA: hypothetical protein VHE13_16795 [Opitutus sp.]|nr:hypothetical protein [Opitutus sp.]
MKTAGNSGPHAARTFRPEFSVVDAGQRPAPEAPSVRDHDRFVSILIDLGVALEVVVGRGGPGPAAPAAAAGDSIRYFSNHDVTAAAGAEPGRRSRPCAASPRRRNPAGITRHGPANPRELAGCVVRRV